jgi:acetoin utilization deacetylase AcuC-like enzyme
MKLKILSNFPLTLHHKGTVDRDNPSILDDFRGKAEGCLSASQSLPSSLQIFDGVSTRTIELQGSSTIEHTILSERITKLPESYEKALYAVHSPAYVGEIQRICEELSAAGVNHDFGCEADLWCGTYQAALSSLYASLQSVDLVLDSHPQELRTFANVWPPGHHAEGKGADGTSDIAMGFCYFSNAAVAAWYARSLGLRTMVIDIDNHSGNGTRKALMNQENLSVVDFVYVSPFDAGRGGYLDGFWNPKLQKVVGFAREYPYRNNDEARGFKIHPVHTAQNILSLEFLGKEFRGGHSELEPASNHLEIMTRYSNEGLPWIVELNPDLIIWSIGLDAAADDPLGALGFLPATMYDIIRVTSDALPQTKMTGILEGGYKPDNWSRYLWPALHGLLNADCGPCR